MLDKVGRQQTFKLRYVATQMISSTDFFCQIICQIYDSAFFFFLFQAFLELANVNLDFPWN